MARSRKLTHLGAEFDLIEETFLGVGVYGDKVATHADDRYGEEYARAEPPHFLRSNFTV